MDAELRDFFDTELDAVVSALPQRVHELLNEVPLVIEDYPSAEVMRRMDIRHRGQLCGLYTGIPLTERSVMHSGVLSDVIHVYREGVLGMSRRRDGQLDRDELRRQIRITVLHELGHHHGLDEDELEALGY